MNILVTGGAGFIGRHTALALLQKGHVVRVLDNLDPKIHRKGVPFCPFSTDIELIKGDVRSKSDWEKSLKDIEVVFHFASYQDYMKDFSTFFHVNVAGTALMYEVIIEKGLNIGKVIVATSQSIYGEGKYSCPKDGTIFPDMRELNNLKKGLFEIVCPSCGGKLLLEWSDESNANPQNAYGMSKWAQEKVSIQFGKRYGIPTTCLRYSIVQGPYQSFFNAYSGACRIFCLSYFFGVTPVIYEDGLQLRDYVNIKDVVEANLLVMQSPQSDYETYNVGGGHAYTVREFVDLVDRYSGKEQHLPPICEKFFRYGDTRHIQSDISKISRLGWKPQRTPEESVRDYFAWLHSLDSLDNVLSETRMSMQRQRVEQQVDG